MTVTDRTLLGAALGILDPGDELALDELLGPSEHLRQSGLAAIAGLRVPNALDAPRVEQAASGRLSAERPVRPGDRVSFVLRWPGLPPDARCAVFRRAEGDTQRVYPRSSTWSPLTSFRQRGGLPLLELIVEPPSGLQHLDVVLISGQLRGEPWPDGSPVWDTLHGSYLEGFGYGVTIDIHVA